MSVRRLVVTLLLMATLLSACATDGGSASNDGPASASPDEPANSASGSGSQVASPSTPAPGEPQPLPAGGEGPVPVPPGRYVSDTTGATITFELTDDTWQGLEDIPGVGFALLGQFENLASLSVVAFDGEVFSDPCDPAAAPTTVDESAEAFLGWLATVPGVEAQAPTATTVGGLPGMVMDLTTALPAECDEPPWIFLWILPTVGDFHFGDAETVRIWAVDAAGGTVALVAEAYEGSDADAFLAAVDDILATMTVE